MERCINLSKRHVVTPRYDETATIHLAVCGSGGAFWRSKRKALAACGRWSRLDRGPLIPQRWPPGVPAAASASCGSRAMPSDPRPNHADQATDTAAATIVTAASATITVLTAVTDRPRRESWSADTTIPVPAFVPPLVSAPDAPRRPALTVAHTTRRVSSPEWPIGRRGTGYARFPKTLMPAQRPKGAPAVDMSPVCTPLGHREGRARNGVEPSPVAPGMPTHHSAGWSALWPARGCPLHRGGENGLSNGLRKLAAISWSHCVCRGWSRRSSRVQRTIGGYASVRSRWGAGGL